MTRFCYRRPNKALRQAAERFAESQASINHPQHYGGTDNPYEAIKVIEAWKVGFCLGNTLKYICRAGSKDGATELEDLKKASWYLERRIQQISDKPE